jgi:hypothetical protein
MKFLRFSKQNHAWQNNVATSVFIFWRIFATWREKKRGLANPTKGFLRFFFLKSPYLDQKNLEVARFRLCIPAGRQK